MGAKGKRDNVRKKCFIDQYMPYSATECEIIRKTGLDIAIVRKVLSNLETYYIASWPENLRIEILGYNPGIEMTVDQQKGLEYLLGFVSERERKCMYGYFRDDRSLRDLGDEFGVTAERIRQIIAKGLRKCRVPAHLIFMQLGYDAAIAIKERLEKETARILQCNEDEFRVQIQREIEHRRKTVTGIPIEELDLSVRAFNALYRDGIRTVEDLSKRIAQDDLLEIRNIGKRTAEEIECVFHAFIDKTRGGDK